MAFAFFHFRQCSVRRADNSAQNVTSGNGESSKSPAAEEDESLVAEGAAAESVGVDHFAEARKSSPYYNRLTDDAECASHTTNDTPKYFRIACLVAALEKTLPTEDLSHRETVGHKLLLLGWSFSKERPEKEKVEEARQVPLLLPIPKVLLSRQ